MEVVYIYRLDDDDILHIWQFIYRLDDGILNMAVVKVFAAKVNN